MKFVLETVSKCSGRLGCMSNLERLPNIKLETPLLLLHTKGGSVPHLSKEVLHYLTNEVHCLEISLSNTDHMEAAVRQSGNGISNFAGLKEFPSFLTLKDPSEVSPSGYHEPGFVPLFTRCGRTSISPERFMGIVDAFKPDFFHTLCDGDTNIESSKKRTVKAVDRSEKFFDECLKIFQSNDSLKGSILLGPIEGGFNKAARETSINHLLKHACLEGFLIDGLHTNGAIVVELDEKSVVETVDYVCQRLPEGKVRFVLGAFNPKTMLELVKLGVDVFDSTYPYLQTLQNRAITFSFNVQEDLEDKLFHLDIKESKYKEQFEPILKNCTCLACAKHTRAYSNHLYNTKEMLGPILLMIHNLHHYIEFFKSIRTHVASDSLNDLIEHISKQQAIIQNENLDAETKITEKIDNI